MKMAELFPLTEYPFTLNAELTLLHSERPKFIQIWPECNRVKQQFGKSKNCYREVPVADR